MEIVAALVLPIVLLLALAWGVTREDARLRRRARRYRELEHEGIDELRRDDPYPEEGTVRGAFLREPDGRAVDAERVLREEFRRVREYTVRRRKGVECLH
jgi:hypothetical protein